MLFLSTARIRHNRPVIKPFIMLMTLLCSAIFILPVYAGNMTFSLASGAEEQLRTPCHSDGVGNSSYEKYKPKTHKLTIDKDTSFAMTYEDTLKIKVNNDKVTRCTSSNKLVYCSADEGEVDVYTGLKEGAEKKVTLKLYLKSGKTITVSLILRDPYLPKSFTVLSFARTLRVGEILFLPDYLKLAPSYSKTTWVFRSSNNKIIKFDKRGNMFALAPGKASVTAVTANKLKKTFTVNVSANRLSLTGKTSGKGGTASKDRWTLSTKSVEMTADGKLKLSLDLRNQSGKKLTSLRDLGVCIYYTRGSAKTLIARRKFGNKSVSIKGGDTKAITLAFRIKDIFLPDLNYTGISKSNIEVLLYGSPYALSDKKQVPYEASSLKLSPKAPKENPVTCRALLVAETNYYRGGDNSESWEHANGNRNSLKMAENIFKKVKGPNGEKYKVTVKLNTDKAQLKSLIASTFAAADSNDISLFYICTHGDSTTPGAQSGALEMASLTKKQPEWMRFTELRDCFLKIPGRIVFLLESCGSGASVYNGYRESAEKLSENLIRTLEAAQPELKEASTSLAASSGTTGALRKANKFYVLTSSRYLEYSWDKGSGESSHSFFTELMAKGVGKSGNMPADSTGKGNKDGYVDLYELYSYIAARDYKQKFKGDGEDSFYQHTQVYPSNTHFLLFK